MKKISSEEYDKRRSHDAAVMTSPDDATLNQAVVEGLVTPASRKGPMPRTKMKPVKVKGKTVVVG